MSTSASDIVESVSEALSAPDFEEDTEGLKDFLDSKISDLKSSLNESAYYVLITHVTALLKDAAKGSDTDFVHRILREPRIFYCKVDAQMAAQEAFEEVWESWAGGDADKKKEEKPSTWNREEEDDEKEVSVVSDYVEGEPAPDLEWDVEDFTIHEPSTFVAVIHTVAPELVDEN